LWDEALRDTYDVDMVGISKSASGVVAGPAEATMMPKEAIWHGAVGAIHTLEAAGLVPQDEMLSGAKSVAVVVFAILLAGAATLEMVIIAAVATVPDSIRKPLLCAGIPAW